MSNNDTALEPWLPTSDMSITQTNPSGLSHQHIDTKTVGVVRIKTGAESSVKNSLICRQTDAKKAFDLFVDTLIDARELPPQPEYPKSKHLIQAKMNH